MEKYAGWEIPSKTMYLDVRGGSHNTVEEAAKVNSIAQDKFVEGFVETALAKHLKTNLISLSNPEFSYHVTWDIMANSIYVAHKQRDFVITTSQIAVWEKQAREAFKEKYKL